MRCFIATILACLVMPTFCIAQEKDTLPGIDKLINQASKQMERSLNVLSKLDKEIISKTENQFQQIIREAEKLDKLAAIDLGKLLQFTSAGESLKKINSIQQGFQGEYLPYLDSIFGMMSFLSNTDKKLNGITESISVIKELQTKLSEAQALQKHLLEKISSIDQFIKNNQEKFGKLQKQLKKINANIAEYSGKIHSIKETFRNPSTIQEKALALLSDNKQFKEFMKSNSFLAGLFPGSSTPVNTEQNIGLYSRNALNEQVSKRLNLSTQEINSISSKMTPTNTGSSDPIGTLLGKIPGKSSNISNRESLERKYDFNFTFQTTRAGSAFPSIADFAITAGYSFMKKVNIGGGVSYKMGMGTGFNNINITHQGLGLRSYADYKWKKTFFITGGFEMNYIKPFKDLRSVTEIDKWTSSGLIGFTKKIDFKTSFVKGMRLQLFWDFLAQGRNVQTQPILFRIGYSF